MKKWSIIAIVVMLLTALAVSGAMAMTLTSTSFKDGGAIPVQYANYRADEGWSWEGAKNISPNLSWDAVGGAVCYVVFMEDTWFKDNGFDNEYHGAFAVPSTCISVAEGASDGKSGKTIPEAFFEASYIGPCPPTKKGIYTPGGKDAFGNHKYKFTVYACKESSEEIAKILNEKAPKDAEKEIAEKSIDSAAIYGNFGKIWKIGGVWNYTATIPETKIEYSDITVTIGATETGCINMKMTEDKEAGREYYDSAVMSSVKGNIKGVDPEGKKFDSPYELKEEIEIPFDSKIYNPGDELCYEYTVPVIIGEEEVELKEAISCVQTEEGKIKGEIKLYLNEEKIIEGDFEATRPSNDSGSGGCNAGFGVLALLFAAPMFYRKKK